MNKDLTFWMNKTMTRVLVSVDDNEKAEVLLGRLRKVRVRTSPLQLCAIYSAGSEQSVFSGLC